MQSERVMEISEQTLTGEVVERLAQKYPTVPPETVAMMVQDIHARFDGRRIRDFVPLFVERNARAELSKLGS